MFDVQQLQVPAKWVRRGVAIGVSHAKLLSPNIRSLGQGPAYL